MQYPKLEMVLGRKITPKKKAKKTKAGKKVSKPAKAKKTKASPINDMKYPLMKKILGEVFKNITDPNDIGLIKGKEEELRTLQNKEYIEAPQKTEKAREKELKGEIKVLQKSLDVINPEKLVQPEK